MGEIPDPGENIREMGGISEKQAGFLKSLLKPNPAMPRNLEGSYNLRDRKDAILDHAMKLNAPTPQNSSEASKLIDDLKGKKDKELPRLVHLEDGDLDDYPEDFPDWSVDVGKKLREKYGKDLSGLQAAIEKQLKKLPEDRRKFVTGSEPGSGAEYRRLVLNPLLKV